MQWRNDPVSPGLDGHLLEGFLLALHISQALVRVDLGKQVIDDLVRNLGFG